MFDWRIFSGEERNYGIAIFVNVMKIFIPFILFCIALYGRYLFPKSYGAKLYIITLFFFFLWGIIPSIISEYPLECIEQWIKYIPRLIFFVAMIMILHNDEKILMTIGKGLVLIGILTALQYLFYCLLPDTQISLGRPILVDYFSTLSVNIYRLCGLWYEPSNASAYLFSIFFITRALEQGRLHYFFSWGKYICLLAGICCFSNAGYLGLSGSVLYGFFLRKHSGKKCGLIMIMIYCAAFIFLLGSLFGRYFYINSGLDSEYLKILWGVRGVQTTNLQSLSTYDASAGRLQLFDDNFNTFLNHPLGIGFRIPGENEMGAGWNASASAPIVWLVFTGIPGILILLFSQWILLRSSWKCKSLFQVNIAQAWLVLELQNLSYGYWVSPMNFLLESFLFVGLLKYKPLDKYVQNETVSYTPQGLLRDG